MKSPIIAVLVLLISSLSCSRLEGAKTSVAQTVEKNMAAQAEPAARHYMDSATKEAEPGVPLERKIIRNADITIEVASTPQAQHSVTSIAEALGGFVVTSASKQRENVDPAQRSLDFKLVVRIPFDKFGVALDQIRKLASNVPEEKTTGEDVTEEFIDLEARIKTQKALELQFIEIMKQAKKVEDALEVQSQLAGVRTEIEKLEGRKRFLENRSSLATITVNIQAPKPVIATTPTGFRHSLSEAASEGVELAAGLVLLFVRLGIVLTPVVVLFGVPLVLIVRYARRRMRRLRLAQQLAAPAAN